MHRLDDAFAQEHEVMRQTKEVRLHGLGRGAAGSGFDFAEFFLELVKNLLPVPAVTALRASLRSGYLTPFDSMSQRMR